MTQGWEEVDAAVDEERRAYNAMLKTRATERAGSKKVLLAAQHWEKMLDIRDRLLRHRGPQHGVTLDPDGGVSEVLVAYYADRQAETEKKVKR